MGKSSGESGLQAHPLKLPLGDVRAAQLSAVRELQNQYFSG